MNSHYDLPLGFWKEWLDPSLQYTCAYYASPRDDLETAQRRKIDRICHKLALKPGERLVELGCGWAGLLIHAVKEYGVEGVGVTLSERQAAHASARIEEEGIGDRASIVVSDIRDLGAELEFDKGAGVGIIEHLGEELQPGYFRLVRGMLRPGGLFLNQGITISGTGEETGGREFLDSYIFPDHEIVPITTTLRIAEEQGLVIRDLESMGEHYVLTLRAWLKGLESAESSITNLTSEEIWRAFRVYLAGMACDFERGGLNVYQTLLSNCAGAQTELPLGRAG